MTVSTSTQLAVSTTPSPGNISLQLKQGYIALIAARDDFERLKVRDTAKALQAAAEILSRREIQIEASMLVMDAERAIAKANPSQQGRRDMADDGVIPKEVKKKIRQAHAHLDDEEYEEIKYKAQEEEVPLTRQKIKDIGRKKHKSEKHQEMLERKSQKNAQEHTPLCELYHCGVNHLVDSGHVSPESIDFVITDPPYDKEAIPLFADLVHFSAEALKPGGSLLCLGGTLFWREQLELMENAAQGTDLKYWWMITYHMTAAVGAASRIFNRKVFTRWKPIFWFTRGEYEGEWVQDTFVCPPKTKEVKGHHIWGQHPHVYDEMLNVFAYPGQLICDPFLGGGTTAASARKRGCGFIGCDIDSAAIRATQERLLLMD